MTDITPREVGMILTTLKNLEAGQERLEEALAKLDRERDLQNEHVDERLRRLEDFRSRTYAVAAIAMGAWMAFGYYLVSHAH